MKEPVISIIIPVFNKWELTQNCLVSLKKQTKIPYEVIVVDNASSDKTAECLAPLGESLFGNNFTRIRYEENRNYGPANNAGAKVARAPLLFFLNNDTIVTEGWETPLIDELTTHEDRGAVGSLLLYEDDTIQHVGVGWGLNFSVGHLYACFPRAHRVASKKREVQTLTGAALMIPKSLFFELGCFNEAFRNGFEDVELCLRIANSGKKLYCLPDSVIYHLESQTSGRNRYERENFFLLRDALETLSANVDIHIHAINDNFLPIINNFFILSVALRKEEEEALTACYKKASFDVVVDVLKESPYWRYGKSLLIDMLEEKGNYLEAFQLAFSVAYSFPTERSLKKAYDLSLLAKRKKHILRIQGLIKEFNILNAYPAASKRKLQEIYDIGVKQNDAFLLKEVERTKKKMRL